MKTTDMLMLPHTAGHPREGLPAKDGSCPNGIRFTYARNPGTHPGAHGFCWLRGDYVMIEPGPCAETYRVTAASWLFGRNGLGLILSHSNP